MFSESQQNPRYQQVIDKKQKTKTGTAYAIDLMRRIIKNKIIIINQIKITIIKQQRDLGGENIVFPFFILKPLNYSPSIYSNPVIH
ncbi:MAG: hypothetical protein ACI9SK_000051 [Zhongshania sp.]